MEKEPTIGSELVSSLITRSQQKHRSLADVCRNVETLFDCNPGHMRAIVNLWRYNVPDLIVLADNMRRQFGLGAVETAILTIPQSKKNLGLFYWLAIEKELQ